MPEQTRSLWQRILSVPVEIVVAIFLILDGIVAPLFRPLMRFLSTLALIQRLERLIGTMPPYLILVLLAVPFGIAELTKVYAVILMAEDHFRVGMTLFIGAYVVSILVCERTFHAGKGQLMTIGWFKVGYDWVMAIKEHILGWLRETQVWRISVALKDRLRDGFSRLRLAFREPSGRKPRSSLEQR